MARWWSNDLPDWFGGLVEERAVSTGTIVHDTAESGSAGVVTGRNLVINEVIWFAIDDIHKAPPNAGMKELLAGLAGSHGYSTGVARRSPGAPLAGDRTCARFRPRAVDPVRTGHGLTRNDRRTGMVRLPVCPFHERRRTDRFNARTSQSTLQVFRQANWRRDGSCDQAFENRRCDTRRYRNLSLMRMLT